MNRERRTPEEEEKEEVDSSAGFKYERGIHRWKHCWKFDRADFEETADGPIGKCPSSIKNNTAQALLDDAIAEPDPFEEDDGYPKRLYNVHKGVIYEAVPTTPGQSYHGYPWRKRPGRPDLPQDLVAELRERSKSSGHEREFKRWLRKYGG